MTGSHDLGVVRALICEDEPLGIRAIREYLKAVPWIDVVGRRGAVRRMDAPCAPWQSWPGVDIIRSATHGKRDRNSRER